MDMSQLRSMDSATANDLTFQAFPFTLRKENKRLFQR